MAHNIWSQRFYGHREAAWHGLGVVNDREQTAVETLEMLGDYNVELTPLTIEIGGQVQTTNYFHIVRQPTPDDPQYRIFGEPVRDYEMIPPRTLARMVDDTIGRPVETMAMLGKGEKLFVTYRLPKATHAVGGFDEVQNYLLVYNPVHPGEAAGAYISHVRTVCQNTVRAAISAATREYTIPHRPGASDLLKVWIGEQWQAAQMTIEVINEAFDLLAKKPVKDVQVKWIAQSVYAMPGKPDPEAPRIRPFEDVMKEWEREVERTAELRDTVFEMYAGKGTGLDDPRMRGTAWSAYQAVCELESYRRGRISSAAQSLINGGRASRMQQTMSLLMADLPANPKLEKVAVARA
ncbi:MAG TPA: DUF932 domain-containing protein [Phototrophicaceae bacterium]|nr:DUF932 domain-containing protein [Phototrophicaceae bacterium]